MLRRKLLLTLAATGPAALFLARAGAAPVPDLPAVRAVQKNWRLLLAKGTKVDLDLTPLEKSKKDWRGELPGPAYRVLFEEDTERPFTSKLNDEKREGVFLCAACGLPLFTSAMKYDSGTGWPSFFTSIPGHLATKTDFKLIWPRTEYHCVRCGGHQGHVFEDGPKPTGERWCNNGVALTFVPKAG